MQGNGSHGGLGLALTVPLELVEAIAQRVVALQPEPPSTTPWLDVDGAASYLCCSKQRIYDLISAGDLSPARDGRRVLFRREWLDAYLEGDAP